ncbi:MAG TPA: extracellular solute-binding protein [Candidatus Methylomirabilis sp.]|nr:extracellular solute-binding protein [Candidatus Methylomirabilis sp.]
MQTKTAHARLGVVVLASFLLVACAPGQPAEPPPPVVVKETVQVPIEIEVPQFPEGTELHILQWSHFVPQYDVWFDPFAEDWGSANGVDVTVDHIALGELPAALTAAIDAGEGPSMVEMVFPPAAFIEGLHDLTDVNLEAQALFGEQVETCAKSSYLPATNTYYGYCHAWVPDPADYDIKLWTAVGFPNGPTTWDDLLVGGKAIKDQFGVPMGLGLSPELDSRMAARAVIWSFGGSVQDENECVTINSPETVEAVEYMAELYKDTMTDEVFAWVPASNNQGLIAGELSYILNSISAYRSLQDIDPAAADNIGFGPALVGPRGNQHASAHVWSIYVIPAYVEGAEMEAAKAFMLHLTANYNQAVFNSKLYNFPGFPSTVPQLDGWLANDPFGSRPANKLEVLGTAIDWVAWLGYPGPANPAIGEVFGSNILVTMMAQAARGEKTPGEAVAEAEVQINSIFAKWRDLGLVGCAQ